MILSNSRFFLIVILEDCMKFYYSQCLRNFTKLKKAEKCFVRGIKM